ANLRGLNIGSNGTAQTVVFWCWSRSVVSAGTYPSGAYASGYNRGRTCTHEVGHWLGLRHIWGDGTCLSDFCDDTPMASASNFGSPVYPYKTANCSGNNPNGEMFMNFMDYTNDPVKYMFTPDQATRIQTAMQFSPYRNQLGTHNLCTVTQVPAFAQFNIPAVACANDVINLVNSSYGTPVPNYTWSVNGPASINPSPNSDPATITFPFGGTYTITLAADNGTLSTFSKTISITPSPTLNILGASPVVCMNDDIVLIAGGAVNYTWQPGNLFGNTFAYTATSDQTISLTGSDGTCKSTWDFTISVTECAGLQGASQEDLILDIYPNPASEQFYIRYGKSFTSLELSDISGRTVLSKALNCATGACTEEISTNEMKNGIYIMQLRAKDGSRTARKFVVEN
ncbi:MAG TPA: M43 family zinc metalloprotease, partial [Bacteroidia bacterium]|nr:M43 family zinc metalloprotease [Bacteroidia bacterium]